MKLALSSILLLSATVFAEDMLFNTTDEMVGNATDAPPMLINETDATGGVSELYNDTDVTVDGTTGNETEADEGGDGGDEGGDEGVDGDGTPASDRDVPVTGSAAFAQSLSFGVAAGAFAMFNLLN